MKHTSDSIKSLIELAVIIALFITFSYVIQKNVNVIRPLMGNGLLSMLAYIFIVVIAVVIAPISAMPLLPLASNLWGWFWGGILSIIGWTIGAFVAFKIARAYGVPLVRRFVPLNKIERVEALVPEQNRFWSVVFLRMVVPVDILSYALGLFSRISTQQYVRATLLGVSPFAFVFAYLGRLPVSYQLSAFLIAVFIFLAGWLFARRNKRKTVSCKVNVT